MTAAFILTSFYGWELAGSPTASGDIFDPTEYTAASKEFEFGTVLEVCYEGCTTVEVTDRGPYVEDRQLDLSEAAAIDIGLVEVGVDEVDMQVLYEPGVE